MQRIDDTARDHTPLHVVFRRRRSMLRHGAKVGTPYAFALLLAGSHA
jgi:hypothetical protein